MFEANVCAGNMSGLRKDMLLVDCGAKAHIVTDKSKFVRFDESFKPERHYIELANGEKTNNIALKRGEVKVHFTDINGKHVEAIMKNVLYVPSFPQDIFSVQAAVDKGASMTFQPDSAELTYKDGTKFNIERHGRLYYIKAFDNVASDKINKVHVRTYDVEKWHKILGHCNIRDVMELESVVHGMGIVGRKEFDCDTCIMGKMAQYRNRDADKRATAPLELVHCDLAGPIDPVAKDGFRYAISFVDDYSGIIMVYFLKRKSDTLQATEKFLADCAPYGKVKCLRSDNGGEFTGKDFESLLIAKEIKHEKSAPHSPHQNGTVERAWRSLFEMAICMVLEVMSSMDCCYKVCAYPQSYKEAIESPHLNMSSGKVQ